MRSGVTVGTNESDIARLPLPAGHQGHAVVGAFAYVHEPRRPEHAVLWNRARLNICFRLLIGPDPESGKRKVFTVVSTEVDATARTSRTGAPRNPIRLLRTAQTA